MDKKQAQDFTENISIKLSESLKDAFEKIEHNEDVQAMKDSAKEVADVATEFIRKYPIQSVLGAAAVGFVLGNILSKKK